MNAHAKYCSFSFLVLGLSMPLVFGQPVPCDAAGPVGPSSVLPWPWWQHTESSYIIHTDGKEYFSQDGATGRIFCRDVDARTVIQDTIDAVADGGRIFFKPGEYTISATHLILDDNLLIEGSQAAVLTSDPNAPTMIMNAQGKANITIAGLTFRDCAAEAIRFKGGADIRILNCRFENIQKDAIINFTDPLERVWIENCLIDAAGLAADGSGSPNYTGIRLKQTRDIFIRNNVVQFCGSTGIAGGAGRPALDIACRGFCLRLGQMDVPRNHLPVDAQFACDPPERPALCPRLAPTLTQVAAGHGAVQAA